MLCFQRLLRAERHRGIGAKLALHAELQNGAGVGPGTAQNLYGCVKSSVSGLRMATRATGLTTIALVSPINLRGEKILMNKTCLLLIPHCASCESVVNTTLNQKRRHSLVAQGPSKLPWLRRYVIRIASSIRSSRYLVQNPLLDKELRTK